MTCLPLSNSSLLSYNWAPFAVFTMVLSVVVISFGTFNILVAIMVDFDHGH